MISSVGAIGQLGYHDFRAAAQGLLNYAMAAKWTLHTVRKLRVEMSNSIFESLFPRAYVAW